MRFVIFVIDGGSNTATPGEGAAIDAFNDRLTQGRHLILAAGREPLERDTLYNVIAKRQSPAATDAMAITQ